MRFFCNATYQGYSQTGLLPVAMMTGQWFADDVPRSQKRRAYGLPLPSAEIQTCNESADDV